MLQSIFLVEVEYRIVCLIGFNYKELLLFNPKPFYWCPNIFTVFFPTTQVSDPYLVPQHGIRLMWPFEIFEKNKVEYFVIT